MPHGRSFPYVSIRQAHFEKANRDRGTLIALSTVEPSRRDRIACSGVSSEGSETVGQIYPELADDAGKRLAEVLFDEISATVKRSLGFKEDK